MRCVAAISNSRQRPLFLRRAALASFAWIGALGLLTGSVAHAAEGITAKDIFVSGTEGSHTYRIPAMIVTNKGTLLAFAEARKDRDADQGNIDLVSKRSADGGKTWNAVELVHEEGGKEMIGIGNPCPVVDVETGHIWLFFCRRNRNVMVTHSTDDGKTWAKVEEMKSLRKPDWSWYATGPGIGIQKRQAPHKGRLVIPCDHRVGNEVLSQSHVLFSDDHGKTWQLGGDVAPRTNECQVAERSDGSLLINARNHWARDGADKSKGGVRITAVSKDGGSTWGDVRFDKALIEPICQASLLRYSSGEGKQNRLLFCNPAHPTKRRILTIRLSYDDGETWPVSKALTVWGAEEYVAYSSLVVLPDGDIGCMYERYQKESGRVGIAFTRLSLAWLTDGKDK